MQSDNIYVGKSLKFYAHTTDRLDEEFIFMQIIIVVAVLGFFLELATQGGGF
jgi:hypothetical protein